MITSRTPSLIINRIKRIDIQAAYTLLAASALLIASMILVAAALADTVWHSRAVKEHSASDKSAIQNHPMRDRLLDG